jgi:O-antigen ligase
VLALGAVYPWAYWPLVWGAFITGLLGLHRGSRLLPTLRHPLLLAVLALCFAVLMQLIPLPASVLRTVSPATAAFVQAYMTLPGEVVATAANGTLAAEPATIARPLSLRPRATCNAFLFALAFGVAIAGGAAGLAAKQARRLSVGILFLGVIVAFIAIAQQASPNGRIYWLWEAQHQNTAWGPFVNRNHFAGWMMMAISVGLGYFMAVSSRAMQGIHGWRNRVLWLSSPDATGIVLGGLALMIMGWSLVLTASRSGIVCFVALMVVVGWAAVGTQAGIGITRHRRLLMMAFLVCLALTTVIWTGLPLIEKRFSQASAATPFSIGGRLQHWNDALHVARHFPVTGTGINTFTYVTPFFKTDGVANADEAHNDYLQLAAEGGLLVGVPAIALMAVFIREVVRRFRATARSVTSYWLRVGAIAGLVAIAIQESVEFSLQLPGNAMMFTALCMLAVHKPEGE